MPVAGTGTGQIAIGSGKLLVQLRNRCSEPLAWCWMASGILAADWQRDLAPRGLYAGSVSGKLVLKGHGGLCR